MKKSNKKGKSSVMKRNCRQATVAVAATAGTDDVESASSAAATAGAGVVSAAGWPFVSVDVQSREIWPAWPHL